MRRLMLIKYIFFILMICSSFIGALAPSSNQFIENIIYHCDFSSFHSDFEAESTDGSLDSFASSCFLMKRKNPCLNCILLATVLETNSQASVPYQFIFPYLETSLNQELICHKSVKVGKLLINFYEYEECILVCQPCMVCPVGPFSKNHPDSQSLYFGLDSFHIEEQEFSIYKVHEGFNKQYVDIHSDLRASLSAFVMKSQQGLSKLIVFLGHSRGALLSIQAALGLLSDDIWRSRFTNPIGLILFSGMRSINKVAHQFLDENTAFFIHITHYGDPSNLPPFSPQILKKVHQMTPYTQKEKNVKAFHDLKQTLEECYRKGLTDNEEQAHYIGNAILLVRFE